MDHHGSSDRNIHIAYQKSESEKSRQSTACVGIRISACRKLFWRVTWKNGLKYLPYLISVLLYIAIANLIGLIGFKPPTKDMGVTAGMAILSILLVEFAGIRQKGTKGWLKSFIEPIPIIAPINLLEVVTRPLSLCMRLFGNVLGSYVVMELLKIVVPAVLPAVFSVYFDIFDGLIQAFVFVFLTALYVGEAAETEN